MCTYSSCAGRHSATIYTNVYIDYAAMMRLTQTNHGWVRCTPSCQLYWHLLYIGVRILRAHSSPLHYRWYNNFFLKRKGRFICSTNDDTYGCSTGSERILHNSTGLCWDFKREPGRRATAVVVACCAAWFERDTHTPLSNSSYLPAHTPVPSVV